MDRFSFFKNQIEEKNFIYTRENLALGFAIDSISFHCASKVDLGTRERGKTFFGLAGFWIPILITGSWLLS